MEAFYERLMVRAATIDELLSDAFDPLPGQKGDADVAARRLAAWCRSCASGDWSLFDRRLERDGWSIGHVLAKFASVRRKACASTPAWIEDAMWIEAALQRPTKNVKTTTVPGPAEPCPFEHLFIPAVEQAEAVLWASTDARAFENLDESARAGLRLSLLKELSSLLTPAIYERFVKVRKVSGPPADPVESQRDGATSQYDQFVAEMKHSGFRRLFEDKPVLLRLLATITRQWIDTSHEFIVRLNADLAIIRQDLLQSSTHNQITLIAGELSDPHNYGRTVQIVGFGDGSRIVYKPKDLRLDAAWHALVQRLNVGRAPVELKAVRTITRDGYGWTEFVDHAGCADAEGCRRFFRRAGAWLALFHCFAATDMHQENMIAVGDHPMPIDLEMILQATAEDHKAKETEAEAFEAAMETVANSVMMVGLLPAYGKSPDNNIFAIGGVTSDWTSRTKLAWSDINSDRMRPSKAKEVGKNIPNLPHVAGRYAKLGDHIYDFVSGFEDYAMFLLHQSRNSTQVGLFDGFAGLPVRTVVRPTRFYYMLLQRLKNHRNMGDGIVWSAQADFMARLTNWERDSDPLWPLQRAERTALVALNVPHFVLPSDGTEIRDATGISVQTGTISGMDRAQARVRSLGEQDIAWQIEVIRQNTGRLSKSNGPTAIGVEPKQLLRSEAAVAPTKEILIAEADRVAEELSRYAIRRSSSAAWIGLDWLGDTEVSQLVALGPDLYNGVCGIAVFLAAHAAVVECKSSEELALAALSNVRKNLRGRNSARMARSLGLGGASGLGSIVYALTVISQLLQDDELLTDAQVAAELFTDDLIAADNQLDVMGGSAGAILGLLRLYRQSRSNDVLKRATSCGRHLLAQCRVGPEGRRSWSAQGFGPQPLNGMSHGAAGFAYALASLASATGREEFANAASECITFENSSYDAARSNWPDLRGGTLPFWPSQWCHGAPGIGLARIAMTKRGAPDSKRLAADVVNALAGVERGWPGHMDTLCCGTLGSIEFFCEAGTALDRSDLRELASRRLMAVLEAAASTGDYRWNTGACRFNLGLFRGLAGVGYTVLRQVDVSLPNILVWE
jgi:type 2 lantibiotic biosynthesis protein LanM